MRDYILRRLLLLIPTLFGITLVTFVLINLAPGGPVEQRIQQIRFGSDGAGNVRGVQIDSEVIEALKKQYGLDKPLYVRYGLWLKHLVTLDFGDSFKFEEPAMNVIVRKFPVSITFGLLSFFLSYLICIPLGIVMAVKENTWVDRSIGVGLGIAYSVPPFMLAILFITFIAGGSFYNWFPIGGLTSENYEALSFFGKIWDRVYHFVLPGICYMIGSFTTLTLLMRNTLIEELKKDYVRTARAKGVGEQSIYYVHALRNAMIPLLTGIGGFLGIFFAGSILIEQIFQLDGIGLLSFESLRSRDYNIIMALTFIESFLMLVGNLIGDLMYVMADPRIDYN